MKLNTSHVDAIRNELIQEHELTSNLQVLRLNEWFLEFVESHCDTHFEDFDEIRETAHDQFKCFPECLNYILTGSYDDQ